MIGRVVEEEYRVTEVIGEGAFGTVYRAEDLRLGRAVALKMLNKAAASEREIHRFLSEGRILASLSHPNVVQIFRLGECDGNPYIVMEYLEGRSLGEVLRQERLPLRRGLETMRQIAGGLGAIHARGIVHRDLSPNNIILTASGTAKILDLGLARDTRDLPTVSGERNIVGTISYMAPEVIDGKAATPASDLFSFGIALYEVLGGRNPFQADHFMAALYNIVNRDPEPLENLVPGMPPSLYDLARQCLQKDPAVRPPDAVCIEAILQAVLEGPLPEGEMLSAALPVAREASQAARNPYLNRVMIKRPEDFFGRHQEIKRIFARLNTTPPGSISIVGDRRIGKSSLLNMVYSRRAREEHLQNPERLVMVFLDLQQEKGMSLPSFTRLLRGMVNVELRGRITVSDCTDDLEGIKEMVGRLDQAGLHLAILLDEFETVTSNPSFDLEFFSFLRYLANHFNVAYLTSSARDLQILCHTKEISDSPFFNIFSTMRLGVFRRADAEELICVPSERVGRPLAPYAEKIIGLAGYFPFYLQIACCHTLEYLDEVPEQSAPDFDEIGRRFFDEAKLHYRYIWEGMDSLERSTIVRLARGRGIPDSLCHVLEELNRRSFVTPDPGGRPKLFAESFAEFIRQEGMGQESGSLLSRIFGRGRG
jgi:serine/threonine protein kinase